MGEIVKKEKPSYEYLGPDGYTRYAFTAEIIKSIFGKKKVSILDVGGKDTFLWKVLNEFKIDYQYTIVDVLEGESTKNYKYVQGSGTSLPFEDSSFDVVLSTDVLEHIDDKNKIEFVSESTRVATGICIIAAPFASPELEFAEKTANDFYKDLFGKNHKWLAEHFACKKPERSQLENWIQANKLTHRSFENNNLELWVSMIGYNFIGEKNDQLSSDIHDLNIFYNKNYKLLGDLESPGYRTFYVIFKQKDLRKSCFVPENKTGSNMFLKLHLQKIIVRILQIFGKKLIEIDTLQEKNEMLNRKTDSQEKELLALTKVLKDITESKLWKFTRIIVFITQVPKKILGLFQKA